MRTLHGDLTTAQRAASRKPYLRIHFDDRDGDTVTFTTRDGTNRIVYVEQWEEPYAGVAIIRLKNHDQALSAVDYRGYSVSIGWGMVLDDTPDANWCSNAAVMKVIRQLDISYQGELVTEFYCVSIWAEIATNYIFEGGKKLTGTIAGAFQIGEEVTNDDSATGRLAAIGSDFIVVTRVTGTFAADDTCTGGTSGATCSGIASPTDSHGILVYASGETTTEARMESLTGLTVDVDEDDPDSSMADSPKLEVAVGTSIRAVIRKMLLRTKCGMRYESDGHLHALYLDTTDAAQYEFQSTHAFFVDLRDRAIIMPNTVYFADKLPDASSAATYVGTANDPTSVSAIGTFVAPIQVDPDIASNEEGNTRAAAWIAQMVAQAYQGKITAPMECGLEVYDMVQAVDTRLNVTSKGRVGRIERRYNPLRSVYEIVMTLGSLYSEPGAMDVNADSMLSDMQDLMSSLDKFPPAIKGLILPFQLGPALLPLAIDIEFTATDNNDISWGAGTITFADKSTQAIDEGTLNLANANPYYLYAIEGNSTLQNTQTFGNAVGGDRFLIAFAKKAPETNQKAMIVPAKGGKSPLLNQDNLSANSITALEIYVSQLSAITADIGLVTAGEVRAGTGTLGVDFTGWRLWVEDSVGRFAGYASDVMQFYSDTDGKLYAGAGKVILDVNGLTVLGQLINLQDDNGVSRGALYGSTLAYVVLAAVEDLFLAAGGSIILSKLTRPILPDTIDLGSADYRLDKVHVNRIDFYRSGSSVVHAAIHPETSTFYIQAGDEAVDMNNSIGLILPYRTSLPTGVEGMAIYRTDLHDLLLYANGAWQTLHSY